MTNSIYSKIQETFGSQPRDGSKQGALWHRRREIEGRLSQLISARSQNVCVDGPTGSGKSSVALTMLSTIGQPFVWIPVYNKMSWADFCEEIVIKYRGSQSGGRSRKSVSLEIDSAKPLAGGELINPLKLLDRLTFAAKDAGAKVSEARKAARDWKIADVEGFIDASGHCLLIDDFEKAPDPLVQAIADLCKRLTTRPVPKCIIIGTGDTFARLYQADEGLDGRLAELPVASFGNDREVWNYLNDGFDRLDFDNPRSLLRSKLITKGEADSLEIAFYEAADGMPKYINELGVRICEKVLDESSPGRRVRVSPAVAASQAELMLQENLSRCNKRIRDVEVELRKSLELRFVLRAIFKIGANGVHGVDRLVRFVIASEDEHFSYDQFVAGFERLRKLGLYVQTGKSGEVIFAKDPMFSHVLGLICSDPNRFEKDPNVFGLVGQRSFPLL
ncbi:hypothetical protein [Bradyrhizobium sp. SZCCHNRI1009]|uniref:hypothetical protein n=1 Tax=Bradyrhizobium sp. SZCCHNRI1009 TaxID=3057277 RepID=UPI002916AD9D|nr:hypothetical protein [Bradyrhizobium sp. SZCCHNRI1009]